MVAARELLASRQDVWAFIAEPRHLADWWPGIAAVEPDRRGLAAGARWQIHGSSRPSLFRRPNPTGTLLVLAAARPERIAFQLTGERMDVELRLDAPTADRTIATLSVSGPWLIGLGRSFPRRALARLHTLVQTAAEM
ncbi:MAG: SRPBCC family protein [Actinobacteria bacterium]|nr:MAG: SRPBCC family protein [Actinomycetota bacterium]